MMMVMMMKTVITIMIINNLSQLRLFFCWIYHWQYSKTNYLGYLIHENVSGEPMIFKAVNKINTSRKFPLEEKQFPVPISLKQPMKLLI